MKEQIIMAVLTFLLGGGLGAFLQTIYSYRKEVLSNLWNKRFEEYQKIWEISGVLPMYPEDRNVSYQTLHETSLKLKDWYFKQGGIILSKQSRKVYEELQKNLSQIVLDKPDTKLSKPDYAFFQKLFSAFRSELTNDLSSRNKSLL